MQAKSFSGSAHGAIDPHTHIYPQSFIEDVRRGRWQHGYGVREEPKVHGAKDPEQYIGKFYYDTIIHNADCFEFAVRTLGVDRIAYGTDYPANMGYHQPARDIPGLSRLSEKDQETILFGNAKKLYGL